MALHCFSSPLPALAVSVVVVAAASSSADSRSLQSLALPPPQQQPIRVIAATAATEVNNRALMWEFVPGITFLFFSREQGAIPLIESPRSVFPEPALRGYGAHNTS
jgi:hypothetical protein